MRLLPKVASLVGVSLLLGIAPGKADDWAMFGVSEHSIGPAVSKLPADRYLPLAGRFDKLGKDQAVTWKALIGKLRDLGPRDKLQLAQSWFASMPYVTDQELYGVEDRWANVSEFLRHGGDCEDFVIARMRALTEAGYPASKLRLTIVFDRRDKTIHAVLAAQLGHDTWLLDNQRPAIVRDRDAPEYRPLFSLNKDEVWSHMADGKAPSLAALQAPTK